MWEILGSGLIPGLGLGFRMALWCLCVCVILLALSSGLGVSCWRFHGLLSQFLGVQHVLFLQALCSHFNLPYLFFRAMH